MKVTSILLRRQQLRRLEQWRRVSTGSVRSSWEQGSGLYPAVPVARLIRLQIRPTPTWQIRLQRSRWVIAHSRNSLRAPLLVTPQAIHSQHQFVAHAPTLRTRDRYRPRVTCSRKVTWTRRPKPRSLPKPNPTQLLFPKLGVIKRGPCHPLLRPLRLKVNRSETFRSAPLRLKRPAWRMRSLSKAIPLR